MLYDDLNLLLGFDETSFQNKPEFDKDSEPDESPESEPIEKEEQ